MKQFRIERIVLDQLSESVQALVEKNYFSDEDYAVSYLTDIVRLFQLNIDHMVTRPAPVYFKRYCVMTNHLKYVSYRKNRRTTWYAFFEEYDDYVSIVYLNNNHVIGHHLEI
jgi:copper oxidase (laccase) domain-containing protein